MSHIETTGSDVWYSEPSSGGRRTYYAGSEEPHSPPRLPDNFHVIFSCYHRRSEQIAYPRSHGSDEGLARIKLQGEGNMDHTPCCRDTAKTPKGFVMSFQSLCSLSTLKLPGGVYHGV